MRISEVAAEMFPDDIMSIAAIVADMGLGMAGAEAHLNRRPSPRSLQTAQVVSTMVWCHDTERDLVARKPQHQCSGEMVSDDKAREIRARRVQRMKDRLSGKSRLAVPGKKMKGSGTGFFVSGSGHLLTNNHVIDKCTAITVTPTSGESGRAAVIGADAKLDLAVLATRVTPPKVATFRRQAFGAGGRIAIVGYPLHGKVAIKPIFRTGKSLPPTGLGQAAAIRFPFKADVRRGNSGGPIVDGAGSVIGVVMAKVNTPELYKRTGKVVRDIGVGIREDVVLAFLAKHRVAYRMNGGGLQMSDVDLFAAAQRIVARIGCWR